MLVLTRQEGEKILIGDRIVVEITHNGSDRVRLGIDAPPEKIVLRAELHEQLKAGIEKSTAENPPDLVIPAKRCG